jgi:hypothetical protein
MSKRVTSTVPNLGQMQREWLCWRQVCKQLEARGIEVNDTDSLASAIRLWGEELVALRNMAPQYHERALKTFREEYEPHVIDEWAS